MYNSTYLNSRISELGNSVNFLPENIFNTELLSVISEVFEFISQFFHFHDLDRRFLSIYSMDVKSLRGMLDLLSSSDLPDTYLLDDDVLYSTKEIIADLNTSLCELETQSHLLTKLSSIGWLEFVGDVNFQKLLIVGASSGQSFPSLEESLLNKLDLFDDDTIRNLWDRVKYEFNTDRSFYMVDYCNVLPNNFLKGKLISTIKPKIAKYTVTYKPQLLHNMFQRGRSRYPSEIIGVSKIFAARVSEDVEPLSGLQITISTSISRVFAIYEKLTYKGSGELADILGIQGESYIKSGPIYKETVDLLSNKRGKNYEMSKVQRWILYEVQKILDSSEVFVDYQSTLAKALLQYKLGIELMAPDCISHYTNKHELHLQKELCQFLLHRGIFAFGSKFGRSEIDLLSQYSEEEFVIETKVYRGNVKPTAKQIKNNLIQLESYIDQSPNLRRGILVIYNLSKYLITEPREWINNRYLILPINLLQDRPNERKKSIFIEPSNDEEQLIVVYRNE